MPRKLPRTPSGSLGSTSVMSTSRSCWFAGPDCSTDSTVPLAVNSSVLVVAAVDGIKYVIYGPVQVMTCDEKAPQVSVLTKRVENLNEFVKACSGPRM